jgi:hypothetical protein
MAESLGPLDAYETEFDLCFETLAGRVRDGYDKLDELAHYDGSAHDRREMILVTIVEAEPLHSLRIDATEDGWITVAAKDLDGEVLSSQCTNYIDEERGPGMHRADTPGPETSPLTKQDALLFIATTLEWASKQIEAQRGSVKAILG